MEHAAPQNIVTTPAKKQGNFFGKKSEPSFFSPVFIQPQLTIGPVDDPYEREADAIADKVMRMSDEETMQTKPSPITLQRKCAACEEEEKVQRKPDPHTIQRQDKEEEGTTPHLKIRLTIPTAPQDDTDDMVNYGQANIELIQRGHINPGELTIPYQSLWNSNYQLSTDWRLGHITRNLYDKGDSLLRPIRGIVKKFPLGGQFLGSKINLDKPDLKAGDWDRYVADKLSLSALGGAVGHDYPTYNSESGFTFTVNIVDFKFDENNIFKRLFRKPAESSSAFTLRRKCTQCEEEEKLQMKGEGGARDGMTAPSVVNDVINSGGQPLDTDTRSFMETRFGYDFGSVRVHNDSLAHQSSGDINALAYTHGNHVVFGAGQYQPHSVGGKQLLAHELAHVVQQRRTGGILQRKFNFIQPTPVKSVNPVTVKYHQDRPIPTNQSVQQTQRNRSLGLTTAIIDNKNIISVNDIFTALNFRLAGEESPPGTFKCRAVTNTTVDVSAEELILTANRSNKWTGQFSDYPNSQCSAKTNIPVTILGDPNANAVETKVQQNEDEHVDDIKKATDDMNARITTIESQVGNGNSEASCQADLLSKTGNDPGREIGREFLRRLRADADARDRSSHTIPVTRNLPSNCSKIEFTFKP